MLKRCRKCCGKEVFDSECDIVVAVVGQPNVGKSTLFNVLTGGMERVGNFPGTTVEMNVGRKRYRGKSICFVDLPGIYSLKAVSIDEKIARDFIVFGYWDVVLVLVDLTSGVEGLSLAIQILQLTNRAVIALTKWDIVEKHMSIDIEKIGRLLQVPVVPISALKKIGIEELLDSIVNVVEHGKEMLQGLRIDYGLFEQYLNSITVSIASVLKDARINSRGLAILIAMGNTDICDKLGLSSLCSTLTDVERSISLSAVEYFANRIYEYIRENFSDTINITSIRSLEEGTIYRAIYRVFQNPFLGFVSTFMILFSAVLLAFSINTGFPITLVFESIGMENIAEMLETYTISGIIVQIFEYLKNTVYENISPFNPAIANLLAYGVIKGVGVVVSFIPLILITLVILSIIEDSGLGPLMALSIHSFFARFGLSGRAIYPLFISLGCNVPGIISSRAALDNIERLEIIASSSFIPCQARLVVMIAIVGYLFPGNPVLQALTVIGIYLGGIFLYLFTAKVFRRGVFRSSTSPELVLEIPRIRKPNAKVVWWNSWVLTKHFIVRAGTVLILVITIVWFLTNYGPRGYAEDPIHSYAFYIGRYIGNAIAPLYNLNEDASWKIGFSILTGFIAKENLLATLVVLTEAEEHYTALQSLNLSIPQGIALLVLFMYYIPCAATVGTIYSESKSLKFTILVTTYIVITALMLSLIVYMITNIILH
ncbi:MAG: ferrous iron transport protein B [Ignisphaera sp.]